MRPTTLLAALATLLATTLAGVVAAPAAHAALNIPQCGGGGVTMPSSDKLDKTCWAARTTVTLSTSRPVAAISAAAVVTDGRPVDKTNLAYFQSVVHCYDASGNAVFRQSAQRNIWPGANPGGNYPKALFKHAPGTYTCQLEVKQLPTGNGGPQPFTLATHYITATTASGGASSTGPNYDAWGTFPPDGVVEVLFRTGDQHEAARTQWTVPSGISTVHLSGMVNLTSCSAQSDVNGNHCNERAFGTTDVTVQLLAYQLVNGGSTQCAAPTTFTAHLTLDQYIHHYIPSQAGDYQLSTAANCSRTVVVKNFVSLNGTIGIYMVNESTSAGVWS